MFVNNRNPAANSDIQVCGIPFRVCNDNGIVRPMTGNFTSLDGEFETLFFLGMTTDSWQCSEWWGQQEVHYNHATRLFIGDRVGRIVLKFNDKSQDIISVLFGINAFNYNLFYKPLEIEGNLMSYNAPYDEPFRSDARARELLDACLCLHENTAPDAQKATKFVFAYKPRTGKRIVSVEWYKDETKNSGFLLTAVSGIPAGETDTTGLCPLDEDFFLGKRYFAAADALRRRLYQYKDELPRSVPLLELDSFDAPDIRFYNEHGLDMLTNVYRKNIMDMAYHKITDDGMTHTSSAPTADFGLYVGFGTYTFTSGYSAHVWTRDIGRMLVEAISFGYFERGEMAVDKLHEFLYYPSRRHDFPHWKRIANLPVITEEDEHNDGLENDGHASVMEAIYTLWRKGAVDDEWLRAHEKELKDGVTCYIRQVEESEKNNFKGLFYTSSESGAQCGAYDLYSNVISCFALRMYARMFDAMEEAALAARCRSIATSVLARAYEIFTMHHPRHGDVLTDTNDDCWTYEYKRFVPLMLQSDFVSYDTHKKDPALFELMQRTFEAQREFYYNPYSGRQMGYGQGYLTEAVLSLDMPQEYTDCVNAAAHLCYHHTDVPYIVPEGVIMHGDGRYWFRNSDLGNAVQQAEIVKSIRLVCGLDDLDPESTYTLIPRLPQTMTRMTVKDHPVILPDRRVIKIAYEYGRGDGSITVCVGNTAYYADVEAEIQPAYIRFGPFPPDDAPSVKGGDVLDVCDINGYRYVYVKPYC